MSAAATAPSPPPLDRLAIHTWTNRPLTLAECIDAYRRAGVAGIAVWREHVEQVGVAEAARMIRGSGLRVPALVRAGFFVHPDAQGRAAAIDDCRRALSDAAALGAETLVIVPGARPAIPLSDARAMVRDALAAVVDEARQQQVRIALEPLHPMYAADRSCVNTLAQAREIVAAIGHLALGVAVDAYHVWWDPDLESGISALGHDNQLFSFHISDWPSHTRATLNDRALMGEGCIDLRRIRSWMDAAGFDGMIEVEIFSDQHWSRDQPEYIEHIKRAFLTHV